MLSIISPSKALDFDCRSHSGHTTPFFSDPIRTLADHMKTLSEDDLARLMKISPKLSELNHRRYQTFRMPFTSENARPALMAFKGDVYQGIDVEHYNDKDFDFAQDHLRILSGLYGLLRPLDLIQPYRLEMGTRLSGSWGKNLYQFWEDRITDRIDHDIEGSKGDKVLINLASNEYFKAVRPKKLNARLLNISFKEKKGEAFKVIGIHAKRARGLMVNYIIRNRIDHTEGLKSFSENQYAFNPGLSKENEWVFSRE